MTKIVNSLLLLALFAGALAAQLPQQPAASADKESFVIQPGAVEAGARGFNIRIVATTTSGFSSSSSKPPQLKFGAGVTVVAGSFSILNQNEAEARIDVDQDAFGTIEAKLELYSVNGSKVLRTLRATLAIKGTVAVPGSQASVGSESIKLVRVNVTDPQNAGVILIKGSIAGTVQITAPTGTTFSAAPVAVIDQGSITSPALGTGNQSFSFGIGNASLANVTVRVTEIKLVTALFGVAGGVAGDLACEVSGSALSGQSALAVIGFTAKTTVEGSNDVTTPSTPTTPSQPSTPTNPATPTNINSNSGLSRGLESTQPRERRNRNNGRNGGGAITRNAPAGGASAPAAPGRVNAPGPQAGPTDNPPAPAPQPGGGAAPVGKPSTPGSGAGTVTNRPASPAKDEVGTVRIGTEAKVMDVNPGLYFCDKDFNALSAIVLDKSVSDEAGGRVWILLKLEKDKNPERVDTVTVKITLGGVAREIILTETGKNTREFRCAKEGLLLVSPESPDSNKKEETATVPIARSRFR